MRFRIREDIAFVLPSFFFFCLFLLYPALDMIGLVMRDPIGVFMKMIADPAIPTVFLNVLIFSIASVALCEAIGLALALCLNERLKGVNFLRGLVTIPWGIPPAVAVALFYSWFEPRYGIINSILSPVIGKIPWFSDYAMVTFILIAGWRFAPYQILGILAALQIIPEEYYEAAKVDGANAWQRFTKITLPMITPQLVILFLIQLMWRINHFELPYLLTGGGPGYSTHLPATYAYQIIFLHGDVSYGALILLSTLGIVIIIAAIIIKVMKL